MVRRVSALREPGTHDQVVRDELLRIAPDVAVEVLNALCCDLASAGARTVWLSLVRVLLARDGLPYHLVERLYRRAQERDYVSVAMPLLPVPARRVARQDARDVPDPVVGELTLGERKWKARIAGRDILVRLLADPDPSVIGLLLDNPRLRELDVVRLAARRPARAAAQLLIATHPVWMAAQSVQVALAFNPYTPTQVGAALAPLLPVGELRKLREDANVHEVLRRVASCLGSARGLSESRAAPAWVTTDV